MNLETILLSNTDAGKLTAQKMGDFIQIDNVRGIGDYDTIKLDRQELEELILKAKEWEILK